MGSPEWRSNARKVAEEIASGDGCVDPVAALEEVAENLRG